MYCSCQKILQCTIPSLLLLLYLSLSFFDRTHSFLCLLPAHHIAPPFSAIMSLHFPSALLLCLPSMVIFIHFPVSHHSLSAMPSYLLKEGFCGKAEITVGLDISLTDALILWAYSTFVNICSFPSPTHCSTPHPLNSHIHWRFSLCIHTLVLHPFLFGIQLHVFKYVPNQRQETCKIKKQYILIWSLSDRSRTLRLCPLLQKLYYLEIWQCS